MFPCFFGKLVLSSSYFFFFNDTATTEIYTLSLHDALPIWPQAIDRPLDEFYTPSTLDWDLWLGPAPDRPYHPAYAPFKWRGWWDFGTGALGDIACHSMDAS